MSDNPAKVRYALGLLSSLEKLREGNIVCDFAVKVGNESFPVHLTVLAASSKYFRAMVESEMIEVKQGFITMKDMKANVIKICIKHMYSGEAEFVSAPVESVLEAAHLMQLDDLVNSCFIHLRNNLSAENCISTVSLSRLYDQHEIEDLAENYILRNLGEISQIESFSSMSKDDCVRYISAAKAGHHVLWQAVIAWVYQKQENRDQLLVELMEVLKIEAFPFQFLLEKIQNEDLLKESKPARDRVIKAMFSDEEVKSNFTVENVFALRKLIQESNLTEKKKKMNIIKDFMFENFEDLIETEYFVQLDEDDILMFLRSPQTKCSSDEFKWKAMLKWTKFERKRKRSFATFFKSIQLERFSHEFIRHKIRIEPMVKESTGCMDLIVQALCDRAESVAAKLAPTPCIAFLDFEYGVTVKLFDVNQTSFSVLSRLDKLRGKRLYMYSCGIVSCNDNIYVLVKQNLYKLDRSHTWTPLASMPGKSDDLPKMVTFQSDIFALVGGSIMACYNTAENKWMADLPGCGIDRRYCVVSSETSLFVLGGWKDGGPTNAVKKFDPTNGSWSNLPPMLIKRRGASATMLHRSIVVAGGVGDHNSRLTSVECYSHLTRSWSALPNMNSCRNDFTLLAICDKLYVCGGDDIADTLRYKDEGTIEVFNEDNAEWQTLKKEKALGGCFIACLFYPKN